jgi:predicted O-methyltransferase YrrM
MDSRLVDRKNTPLPDWESWAEKESIPVLSPVSGKILSKLISWLKPKSVLELGMGGGISLYWILKSISWEVEILTVDRKEELLLPVEERIRSSGLDIPGRLFFKVAQILDSCRSGEIKPENYEFIFVDCDKITYPHLLEIFLEKKVQKESSIKYVLFDNVLWHGRLIDEQFDKPSDRAMRRFWDQILESGVEYTLFPSGDGLLLLEF